MHGQPRLRAAGHLRAASHGVEARIGDRHGVIARRKVAKGKLPGGIRERFPVGADEFDDGAVERGLGYGMADIAGEFARGRSRLRPQREQACKKKQVARKAPEEE